MYCKVDRELETTNSGREPKRLSLMRFSFNKPEVQHERNNCECCNYLKTVEKFI